MRRLYALLVIGSSVGCQPASPSPRFQPSRAGQAEALAGLRASRSLENAFGGIVRDQAAELRMEAVGTALIRYAGIACHEYRFRVLNSTKPNAFSLPGGLIYVTRGLYRQLRTDDLLAAVLAHEFAHLEAKDSLKPPCKTPDEALARELSADRLAAGYLFRAGYTPQALVDLLRCVEEQQPPGWVEARTRRLRNPATATHDGGV